MNIKEIRKNIDTTDREIADLLKKRMDLSKEVAEYKVKNNMAVNDSMREQEILKNLYDYIGKPCNDYVNSIFESIIEASKAYQYNLIKDFEEAQNKPAEPTKYGLIGKSLSHSYSKLIHEKFGYNYKLLPLNEAEFAEFLTARNFEGLNITIPYKKTAMKYCDEISDIAREIGAINTVCFEDDKMVGTNTDYRGFLYMCEKTDIDFAGKKVLILGAGGACATVIKAAADMNSEKIFVASRQGTFHHPYVTTVKYDNLPKDADILINTTPLGTYPHIDETPVNLMKFSNLCGVLDLVYNPLKTNLLLQAENLGIKNGGGLSMLVAQAVESEKFFSGFYKDMGDTVNIFNRKNLIDETLVEFRRDIENIVLIGMPSSGKTSIGKEISKKTKRKFMDTDAIIRDRYKKTPGEIILTQGEDYFRKIEVETISELAKEHSLVISTGGGAVLRKENISRLKQNSHIYFVDRKPALLTNKDRPLSKGKDKIKQLYNERIEIYRSAADTIIENNENLESAVSKIFNAHFGK